MGEGTSSIREEIEETRARVGEDVEALSYKTDVGARLDDYVTEKKDAVTSTVSRVVPGSGPPRQRVRSMQHTAERNPLGLAVGGAAVGFLAGMLLPSTRVEDEHLGDLATKVRDTAAEAGQEALDRGKDVAQSAIETAREEGKQQGRELASDLSDRVQQEAQQGSQAGLRPSAA